MLTKNRTLKCCLLIAVLLVLLLLLAAGSGGAEGKTITVDDDGGADYEKIQDAVNAAEGGDTISVWEGTYQENVLVDKSVSPVGNGSDVTSIDAGGEGSVVKITADWVNISAFHITGSGNHWPESGIKVESNHNHIFKNNCSYNGGGSIFLEDSTDCTITNNTCSANNYYGIRIYDSSYCKVTNNTCSANNYYGIRIYDSSYCKVTNNTCENNANGIYLDKSYECIITNNTCSNNTNGIFLEDSSHCTIMNNTMNENGIIIEGFSLENWNSHTIKTTNTVNGKSVYYYKNVTGFTVHHGVGQVILANCSWMNVENQNCSNGSVGIMVGYSSLITITNNTCSSNRDYGINLWYSSNCTVTNNICENNYDGIFLYLSRYCTIKNNICENNYDGIY